MTVGYVRHALTYGCRFKSAVNVRPIWIPIFIGMTPCRVLALVTFEDAVRGFDSG